jgi:hypothetical protein
MKLLPDGFPELRLRLGSRGRVHVDIALEIQIEFLELSLAFIWAHESYRARSLWPAVFFHSFHNTISQWLFPKFFAGGDNELWLGEGGRLPLAGYIIVGVALYLWMRLRGSSWQELVQTALETASEESSAERSASRPVPTGCQPSM